jgi:hypothetical protein
MKTIKSSEAKIVSAFIRTKCNVDGEIQKITLGADDLKRDKIKTRSQLTARLHAGYAEPNFTVLEITCLDARGKNV